jgi:hypothetical protein
VDLHLMLRWHSAHFSAFFQQPAQSFVVLYSGVAMTCTYRLAILATSCIGTVGSPLPFEEGAPEHRVKVGCHPLRLNENRSTLMSDCLL